MMSGDVTGFVRETWANTKSSPPNLYGPGNFKGALGDVTSPEGCNDPETTYTFSASKFVCSKKNRVAQID